MRPPLFAVLLVVSLVFVGSAPAVAQSTEPSPQPTATNQTTERIDNQTSIVDSRLVEEDNATLVYLTLRSSAVQEVRISDAGAFQQGGEIPVRTIALGKGETATIEIPAQEANGYIGVAISTEETPLYAEVLQRPTSTEGGLNILKQLGSLQAWLAGVTVAFTWMIIAAYSVLRREDHSPEVAT